jgi:hypothetical protein
VIHSFWIPDFRVKMDVFPNRYTGYTFETPTLAPGEDYTDHWIFCAEYCGDFHSEMAAVLRVVPYGEFKDDHRADQWALGDLSPIEIGQRVHASSSAPSATRVDGSAMTRARPGSTSTATRSPSPTARPCPATTTTSASRSSTRRRRSTRATPTSCRLRDPGRGQEIVGVIAYMESLSDRSDGPPKTKRAEGEGETESEGGDASGEGLLPKRQKRVPVRSRVAPGRGERVPRRKQTRTGRGRKGPPIRIPREREEQR